VVGSVNGKCISARPVLSGIRELSNANLGHDTHTTYRKFLVVFLSDSSEMLGQYLNIYFGGHLSGFSFNIGQLSVSDYDNFLCHWLKVFTSEFLIGACNMFVELVGNYSVTFLAA
jgi:hypothetical protein